MLNIMELVNKKVVSLPLFNGNKLIISIQITTVLIVFHLEAQV